MTKNNEIYEIYNYVVNFINYNQFVLDFDHGSHTPYMVEQVPCTMTTAARG